MKMLREMSIVVNEYHSFTIIIFSKLSKYKVQII